MGDTVYRCPLCGRENDAPFECVGPDGDSANGTHAAITVNEPAADADTGDADATETEAPLTPTEANAPQSPDATQPPPVP